MSMTQKAFFSFLLASIAISGFSIDKNRSTDALLQQATPCVPLAEEPASGLNLDASFLIWQAKEWGLEFGAKSLDATNVSTNDISLNERGSVPDFAWRAGLKLDLGYRLPYDGWDVLARWTYYHGQFTNLKRTLTSSLGPSGLGVVPLWIYPFYSYATATTQQVRYGSAKGNWKLYFNSLDAEIGDDLVLRGPLSFRFQVGAKGAWVRQQFHIDYGSGGTQVAVSVPGVPGTSTLSLQSSGISLISDAWGLGPRAGFGTHWLLGWGFRLSAEGAFSLLYETFKISRQQTDTSINTSTQSVETRNMALSEHLSRAAPVVETRLGFDWGGCADVKGRQVYFRGQVLYEMQYWWAQNSFRRNYLTLVPANETDMRGDLQMQGLTVGFGAEF